MDGSLWTVLTNMAHWRSKWNTTPVFLLWASHIAQLLKNLPAMQETPVQFLGWEIPWRRDRLPSPVFLGFSCGSAGKESDCKAGDLGSIPALVISPGERKGYPLQYSGWRIPWTIESMGSQRVGHD